MEIPKSGLKKIEEARKRQNWTKKDVYNAILEHEKFQESGYAERSFYRSLSDGAAHEDFWVAICTVLDLTLADITQEEELGQFYEGAKMVEAFLPSQITEYPENTEDAPSPPTESIYIERPPLEQICCKEIQQDGALLRIKAPHKMGKTLLLKQILDAPQVQEYSKVRLDLQLLASSNLSDSSQFLRWLCQRVSKRLKWESCLDEYWDGMTPNTSCTDYFEEYILEKLDNPLVLGIDNIDRIFAPEFEPIAQDFFGLLRSWWGFAQTTGGNWKKLRLIVIYSTEELPKLETYQSPFNVGEEVKIPELNEKQIYELAQRYQLDLSSAQVQEMKQQIGGHPYLVHNAIKYLTQNPSVTVSHLLKTAATDEGIYASHWQYFWSILEKDLDLARQLKLIVNSEKAVTVTPTYLYKLDSMGLVQKVGNQVQPRCPLYRRYFSERLKSYLNEH